jgi:hypothetical protein
LQEKVLPDASIVISKDVRYTTAQVMRYCLNNDIMIAETRKDNPMRKQRIYLETTLFNFYFDQNREAHADTVKLFEDIANGKYLAYTSVYVADELSNAPSPKRENMLGLIERYSIEVLPVSENADILADMYVKQGIIPIKYRTDGVHIAVASINYLDMIVSMNFQHIVKRKTRIGTGAINALYGYPTIEILAPMEVNDYEV